MDATVRDASIRRSFRSMSQVQWALTATTLGAVCLLVAPSTFRIDHTVISSNVLFGGAFGMVAVVYTYLRFDLTIATFCDTVAQLCLFVMIAGVASYVAAHYGAWSALRDGDLLAVDRAFGLDWRAYLRLVADHPVIGNVFNAAYRSLP